MPPIRRIPRPGLQTRPNAPPHPSIGRGFAYSHDMRTLVMGMDGLDHLTVPEFIHELCRRHILPSQLSKYRWEQLEQQVGHYCSCRRTGNNFATRLCGFDLILLALYWTIYPKASAAKVNAFLYRINYGNVNFSFYSHSQISKAETMIGLSRKAGSCTAYQAFLPRNIQRREEYWNYPYPIGIADCRRRFMIDLDECGLFLETANRKYGKSYVGLQINEPGPYAKSEKWNLLMAVCGEEGVVGAPSRQWTKFWTVLGGTTVNKMYEFIQEILNDIGPATPGSWHCFTMDNLNAHKNIGVLALIYAYGHGVCFRAPYYPVDGAIEYIFNTLQILIRSRLHEIHSEESLRGVVQQTVQSMCDFAPYFEHVGFIHN